jgi:hypothetical protein
MKKAAKKAKAYALPAATPIPALPPGKKPAILFLPRGGFSLGALILVLVTVVSLAASALFYLKTLQAIRYSGMAGDRVQSAARQMNDLENKLNAYENGKRATDGQVVSCAAQPIAGDKTGDAALVCTTGDGGSKTILTSIRAAFNVKTGVYAPVVSAFLGSGGSTVYIVSGVKGNATAYHVWTYDLTSGKTADISGP